MDDQQPSLVFYTYKQYNKYISEEGSTTNLNKKPSEMEQSFICQLKVNIINGI